MCYKGNKGPMGYSGSYEPEWLLEIIKFRNQKLNEDYIKHNYDLEKVDRLYDDIDAAISTLQSFYNDVWNSISEEELVRMLRKKKLEKIK